MKKAAWNEPIGAADVRFDRLVDGSLSADEYCTLLASLDDEPGAWRKCALAFLESQALAQELGNLRQATCDKGTSVSTATDRTPHRSAWRNASVCLAMAVSFLGALALGVYGPQLFPRGGKEPVVVGNLNNQTPADSTFEDADYARNLVLRPVGNLRLVVDGPGGASAAGQVPVYEAGTDLEQMLGSEEAALGPELIDLFRQNGYEVRHEQQYVPAPLEDGRQVIVPVQGYEIRPVSRVY